MKFKGDFLHLCKSSLFNLNGLRPPVVIFVNYTSPVVIFVNYTSENQVFNLNGLRPPVVIFVNYTSENQVCVNVCLATSLPHQLLTFGPLCWI